MTLKDFERIVLILSNQGWIRYWIHWNYPQKSPWKMAISFFSPEYRKQFGPNLKEVLAKQGFSFETQEGHEYAIVERDRTEI